MYSWEIGNTLAKYNYNIPASVYINICRTSPQIIFIKRLYDNRYKLVTKDKKENGVYEYPEWELSVYPD